MTSSCDRTAATSRAACDQLEKAEPDGAPVLASVEAREWEWALVRDMAIASPSASSARLAALLRRTRGSRAGQVVDRKLEGVVAKRLDSLYRPGSRNGAWIKIKPSYVDAADSIGRRSLEV